MAREFRYVGPHPDRTFTVRGEKVTAAVVLADGRYVKRGETVTFTGPAADQAAGSNRWEEVDDPKKSAAKSGGKDKEDG